MKWLDGFLRDVRLEKAAPFVRSGDRLLDVGCRDQTMLRRVIETIRTGVGVDPLAEPATADKLRIVRAMFPSGPGEERFADASFDCITMLAVLEHVGDPVGVARECARLLAPGGRVVITVPKPQVDAILWVLTRLRLMDGWSIEQHHGYDVRQTTPTFEKAGLRLLKYKTFELGLNCLFVFEKR